jgi:hypothetical protein
VNVAVPLISAALAALVAWIVAIRQGRTARENWVLDKRYVLYERVLEPVSPLSAAVSHQEATDTALDPDFRARVTHAVVALELLAPEPVRELSRSLIFALAQSQVGTTDAVSRLHTAVRALRERLREDLVPEHMR